MTGSLLLSAVLMYRVGRAESRRPGAVHTSRERQHGIQLSVQHSSSTACTHRPRRTHGTWCAACPRGWPPAASWPGCPAADWKGWAGVPRLAGKRASSAAAPQRQCTSRACTARSGAGQQEKSMGRAGEQSVGASAKHCMPGPRTTSSLKLMLSNMYASRLASGLMDSSGMARNSVEVMKPCTQAQAGHCRRWVGCSWQFRCTPCAAAAAAPGQHTHHWGPRCTLVSPSGPCPAPGTACTETRSPAG